MRKLTSQGEQAVAENQVAIVIDNLTATAVAAISGLPNFVNRTSLSATAPRANPSGKAPR